MQKSKIRDLFSTLLGVGVACSLTLTSCEDQFTEEDALNRQDSILVALKKLENQNAVDLANLSADQQLAFQKYQDSLERIGPVVNYTVMVVAGGSANTNARTNKAKFAEGATVTVTQGGVSRTETTDEAGVVAFSDLRIGEAVVTVKAENHTTVTYTTSLGSATYELTEDHVETTIPVFPTTLDAGATQVTGTAWAELNTMNDTPEFAEGAVVRATLSVGTVLGNYGVPFGSTSKGEIRTATYSDFVKTATVGADGTYSLILPNGNGDSGSGLPVNIEFLPYTATQTFVAMQGDSLAVMSKEVIFGNGGTTTHLDSDLPSVYLEIAEPVNTAQGFELGTKVIPTRLSDGSEVFLDKRGSGYEVGDKFIFAAGKNGKKASFIVTSIVDPDGDGKGVINTISDIDDWDTDADAVYETKPAISQDTENTGTGATFILNFATYYNLYVANEGSGYWDVPQVSVSFKYYDNTFLKDGADDDYGVASLQIVDGKIKANSGNADTLYDIGPFPAAPEFTVIAPEVHKAFIDPEEISIDDEGRITSVNIFGGDNYWGAGYTSSPVLTFKTIGENMGSGAKAIAAVSNGEITSITITHPGSGYKKSINTTAYAETSGAAPASADDDSWEQSDEYQFKPASTNANHNFNYGTGVMK